MDPQPLCTGVSIHNSFRSTHSRWSSPGPSKGTVSIFRGVVLGNGSEA